MPRRRSFCDGKTENVDLTVPAQRGSQMNAVKCGKSLDERDLIVCTVECVPSRQLWDEGVEEEDLLNCRRRPRAEPYFLTSLTNCAEKKLEKRWCCWQPTDRECQRSKVQRCNIISANNCNLRRPTLLFYMLQISHTER